MTEHCGKCGTALDPDQWRHQRFRVDHVSEDVAALEGALCSDCFVAFAEWLEAA